MRLSKKIDKQLKKIEEEFQKELDNLNLRLLKKKVYYGHKDKQISQHWLRLEFVRVHSSVTRSNSKLLQIITPDIPPPFKTWESYRKACEEYEKAKKVKE